MRVVIMDATENEVVLTQSYPVAATALRPPPPRARPTGLPSDACPVARNADRDRPRPPSVAADPIVMQSARDIFDWGSDEEEDDKGGDDEEEVVDGGCSGDAADPDPELPASHSLPNPTPTATPDPPDTDPWDSPEYLAGPELADAFTLAVAREQVQDWASACGFNVIQKSADQRVGKATFRCSCKGRKHTGGGRNDTLEAGNKRARQTTYALPGEEVCPFQ